MRSSLIESASAAIGSSLQGKLPKSLLRNLINKLAMSCTDRGSRHSLIFCSLLPLRPIPYWSNSPNAGDRESPHLPLGNSSQSCVRITYDLFRFLQKIGLTFSSRRLSPRDCLHGNGCFSGVSEEGVSSSSSSTMRVACAKFIV